MTGTALTILAAHGASDAVAVGPGGTRTRADLMRDVAKIVRGLPDHPGGRAEVLVDCKDTYLFAAAMLAAWEAGFAVALPANRRPHTLNDLLARDHVRGYLYDVDLKTGTDVRDLVGSENAVEARDRPSPLAVDQHIATVHTSGTTGDHQASPKTAGQLIGEAQVLIQAFSIEPGTRVLATVPPIHIYGLLFGILLPLCCGGAIVRENPLHAETVARTVASNDVAVLVSTPAHLRGFEVLEPGTLSNLRRLFSSGAPLHRKVARMLSRRLGAGATEVLGSTETGGIAWRENSGGDEVPPWQPLPGVRVDVDADGRLLLDSPFLEPGTPVPHPCEDRIELLERGTFVHRGRLDDVVKIAGKRLAVGELERRLISLPGVHDAAALAEPSSDGRGSRVRAAAVAPGRTSDELREALAQWFDPVVVPRKILLVDALPREESGKLARGLLIQLLDAARAAQTGSDRHLAFGDPATIAAKDGIDAREVEVNVPYELFYFRGHFPDHPVLPGVAQLERVVLYQIGQIWPNLGHPRRVTRVKFKNPIEPGDTLRLRLEHDLARAKVAFKLARGDEVCATGALLFA